MVDKGCEGYQGKTGKGLGIAAQKMGNRMLHGSAGNGAHVPQSFSHSAPLDCVLSWLSWGGSCSPMVMDPKADRLDTRKCLAIVACQQAGKYGKLRSDLWLMRVRDEVEGMGGRAREMALQTDSRNPPRYTLVPVRRTRTRLGRGQSMGLGKQDCDYVRISPKSARLKWPQGETAPGRSVTTAFLMT